jgi:hypothetical protein
MESRWKVSKPLRTSFVWLINLSRWLAYTVSKILGAPPKRDSKIILRLRSLELLVAVSGRARRLVHKLTEPQDSWLAVHIRSGSSIIDRLHHALDVSAERP